MLKSQRGGQAPQRESLEDWGREMGQATVMAVAMGVGAAWGFGWVSAMRRLVRVREVRARFETLGALSPSTATSEAEMVGRGVSQLLVGFLVRRRYVRRVETGLCYWDEEAYRWRLFLARLSAACFVAAAVVAAVLWVALAR